ncbi:MAG TPA: AAA family ATPase [Gaiellaceae bacterium]
MHLRAIRIRGFKSFPEPVEVRLEPGVAVVVGPNGSGKSNVADALLWACGSLSPSELRAEKPDDVLFAGSGGRQPAEHCQVELLLDNEDGGLPGFGAEISIMRRLHRGGEGQYLINGAGVRRTDLVELLADIGLGGAAGSVISQGKVEEILASKPEERRALVEDAAGLGKFKRRRHRAELKLARVAQDVERARDVEAEVRKRLRPLALQATAAQRAEKLGGEIAGLEAAIASIDLRAIDEHVAAAQERRAAADHARRRSDSKLEDLLAERHRAEEELADAAGRRESATAALYRLRSAAERVSLRRESAAGLVQSLEDSARKPRLAIDLGRQRLLQEARGRLAALETMLAEREGVPPAARALAEDGHTLVLSRLDVPAGDERAVAAALRGRGAAVVAPDERAALALVREARRRGLGSVTVVIGERPLEEFSIVEEHELLDSQTLAVTREGIAYDPARRELWFAGEAAEAVLLELEARRRELADEVAELERRDAEPETVVDDTRYRPLIAAARRLEHELTAAAAVAARSEPTLRARADAGSARTSELAEELRKLGAAEAEVRREASEVAAKTSAVDVDLARLHAERGEAQRRLEAAGAEPAEGEDRDALAERVEKLRRRREELGRVNPLAAEEYEREKENLADLTAQREDLEASLTELAKLRDELRATVERRFAETFDAVSRHFQEVAETLFPGGQGRLRLTGEQEGDDEDSQPGIEVELRPAGKRVTRLSLLSGGEKALGAISFLFALFLARPCPFYLLDEVEAALDDANIGRVVELLRRYAGRAQFIVITHQKKTIEAADILYGVTMGAEGVSQVISRRLPRETETAEAAA